MQLQKDSGWKETPEHPLIRPRRSWAVHIFASAKHPSGALHPGEEIPGAEPVLHGQSLTGFHGDQE